MIGVSITAGIGVDDGYNLYFSPQPGPGILKVIAKQITHVLNLLDTKVKYPSCIDTKTVICHQIPMTDEGEMLETAEKAADYIHDVLQKSKSHKVLVHCKLGVNRSPFVVLVYLCKYQPLTGLTKAQSVEQHIKYLESLKELSINPPWKKMLRKKYGA
jgi:protein-tyrosine phosphatase